MNENHLQQIFNNYIDRFEEVNNTEHQEYYKWQIIKRFRSMMDEALTAEPDDLAAKLYAVKRLTYNLIDNYTQPFHGLSKYAEKEPETAIIHSSVPTKEMFEKPIPSSFFLRSL